jgi:hypothetical protein
MFQTTGWLPWLVVGALTQLRYNLDLCLEPFARAAPCPPFQSYTPLSTVWPRCSPAFRTA